MLTGKHSSKMVKIREILDQYNVGPLSKVVFLGSNRIDLMMLYGEVKYEHLYLIDEKLDVYDGDLITRIRGVYGDPSNTHFPDSFFDAVILTDNRNGSIDRDLLDEAVRILAPSALLLIILPDMSVLWGDKLSRLSSAEEQEGNNGGLKSLMEYKGIADKYKIGSIRYSDDTNAKEKCTFVPIKIYKEQNPPSIRSKISILYNSGSKSGGIYKHCEILHQRLKAEYGIDAPVYTEPSNISGNTVIIEYNRGGNSLSTLLKNISELKKNGNNVIVECHSILGSSDKRLKFIQENSTILYRSNESAIMDGATRYLICPIISYKHIPLASKVEKSEDELLLCTFGYPFKTKRIEEIARFSEKNNIPLNIYISPNKESETNFAVTSKEVKRISSLRFKSVKVVTEYFDDEQLLDILSKCSHIIFAQNIGFDASGTMTFSKRARKPIIGIDGFQARQSQVFKFPFLDSRIKTMVNEAFLFLNYLRIGGTRPGGILFMLIDEARKLIRIASRKPLLKSDLYSIRDEVRDEDGLEYIMATIKMVENSKR